MTEIPEDDLDTEIPENEVPAEEEQRLFRDLLREHYDNVKAEQEANELRLLREESQKKAKEGRVLQGKKATEAKSQRIAALQNSRNKVRTQLSAANTALALALREATATRIDRYSTEGVLQHRLVGSIQKALVALKQISRTLSVPTNDDIELDIVDPTTTGT